MSLTQRPECRPMSLLSLMLFIFYNVGAQSPLLQASVPLPSPPPKPDSVYINPMVVVMTTFIVSAVFFAIFISIYIIHCSSPPSFPRSNLSVPKGLDPKVIGGFPTFVYSEVKEHKIGKRVLECVVCLCEFEDNETLCLIQMCDHVFHQECINEWLSGHVTCPVCRANLAPPSEDSVKDRTDCMGPEQRDHVEINIDEEVMLASEEVMRGKNEEGEAVQSDGDIGSKSHSGKSPRRLGRSHSTGHSLAPLFLTWPSSPKFTKEDRMGKSVAVSQGRM